MLMWLWSCCSEASHLGDLTHVKRKSKFAAQTLRCWNDSLHRSLRYQSVVLLCNRECHWLVFHFQQMIYRCESRGDAGGMSSNSWPHKAVWSRTKQALIVCLSPKILICTWLILQCLPSLKSSCRGKNIGQLFDQKHANFRPCVQSVFSSHTGMKDS